MARVKKDEGELELNDVADARLEELRNADNLVEIISLRPGDPNVKLPMAPICLHPRDTRFKPGNTYNKASVGEYREAIQQALNDNPQLWIKLFNRMTPAQRDFMTTLADSVKLKDCFEKMAQKRGDKPENWYNRWRSWPEPIREAILYGSKALYEDPINAATAIKKAYLTKAALVKVSGLDSEDERTRQNVATELLEWEYGKAGVRVTTDNDGKYDDLMERIAAATERAAGMPLTIEGAVDVTPDKEEIEKEG